MTESHILASAGAELPPPAMAGVLLRVAREAAGMSIDMVAQQLKLAPRQVKALEDGDYTHLPGRTFVRGFVRSYARLVRLDPERVLRALPAGTSAPTLEAPTLTQTAPTMGELPTTDRAKASWTRWAIPLTLVAIIVAAGIYEWLRPPGESLAGARIDSMVKGAAPAAAPKDAQGASLHNPLAAAPVAENPTVAPEGSTAAVASTTSAALPGPATMSPATAPALDPGGASAAPSPAAPDAANANPAAASPRTPAAEQPLALAFRDNSWTEVRDRDGRVLLSGMYKGGTAQTLSGAPPIDLVIGNAVDVTLRYKGEPVDLGPYTRQNVARLTLQ